MIRTLHDPVILTSTAWAAFATLLVGIERWHRIREDRSWADHSADLRENLEAQVGHTKHAEAKHLAAERGLREYARAVELFVRMPQDEPTSFGVRHAARNGREMPLAGSVHRPEGWQ